MSHNVGRHRAPRRYNPATEIGQIITEAGTPLAKGSAVVAASGGLVAAIAIPAQASPVDTTGPASQAISAVQADASDQALVALDTADQAAAVTAPAAKASAKATQSFGKVAVKPVAKPTGPSEEELRERAEREAAEREAAEEAAAERQAEAREEAAPEEAAPEQAEERQESAPSRSQERQAPSQTSAPTQAPEPTSAPAPTSGGVIGIAKQYIGTPYVYGGSTPSGFDCSGFTQYVFAKAGKSLPRVTTAQQAATTPVSNPQPGDLVFFGSPAYHVGIYVGDGMMIDAPSSGKSVSVRPVFSGVSGYGRV